MNSLPKSAQVSAILCVVCAVVLLGCDDPASDGKPGGHGHGEEAATGASFKVGRGITLTPETKQRLAVQVADPTEETLSRRVEFTAQVFATGGRSGTVLRASGTLPATAAALLRAGFPVQVQRGSDAPVPGTVRAVHSPFANGDTEVELDLPADAPFQPRDFLAVTLALKREHAAKVIPGSALLRTTEGTFAYVVNGSAYLRTAVKVGVESNGKVEITDGLLAGDAVVTSAVEQLYLIELRAVKGGGHCH